jgi:CRISPR-associated Csx2 family protein
VSPERRSFPVGRAMRGNEMTHTLVTFLGKGQGGAQPGYSEATYEFPNGDRRTTKFFGLALAEHLQPDRIVILGTRGSMWGVLVEDGFTGGDNIGDEEARLELFEAERAEKVDQSLLDRVKPVMQQAPIIQRIGRPDVVPRIVPFGRNEMEQWSGCCRPSCWSGSAITMSIRYGTGRST